MRDRRGLFGLEYIGETFDCYEKRIRSIPEDDPDPLLAWAYAVLELYFFSTDRHDLTDSLREKFIRLPTPNHRCNRPYVPYKRDITNGPPVKFKELSNLARRRRSVRWFLTKPVSRELIRLALTIAIEAPSACNRQPFVIRIFDEPKLVRQVISIPMGTVRRRQRSRRIPSGGTGESHST